MTTKRKRFLCLVLALCLSLSLAPTTQAKNEKVYTITFNPGRTGDTPSSYAYRQIRKGDPYGEMPEIHWDGHEFVYWKVMNGDIILPGDTFIFDCDVVVCGMWRPYQPGDFGPGSRFTAENSYTGQFKDVPRNAWYYTPVSLMYELGMFSGVSKDRFNPDGNVTIAQLVSVAARVHSEYNYGSDKFSTSGPTWYYNQLNYLKKQGIITKDYDDYDRYATRAEVAVLLAKLLDREDLYPINLVFDDTIPDVPMSASYAGSVYYLYRAGVLSGSDSSRRFNPNSLIKRSEFASVVSRLVGWGERTRF